MPLGKNVSYSGDKLIKKTEAKKVKRPKKAGITNIVSKENTPGQPSLSPGTDTYKTKKMTFYVKEDLLERLYNFSYWDRHSVTEALNTVLIDGLKGKNTKPRPQK